MRTEEEIRARLETVREGHAMWVTRYEQDRTDLTARLNVEYLYGQISILEWMLGLR